MTFLGSSIKHFKSAEWAKIAEDVVKSFLSAKFTQNENLKSYLLSTGSKIQIEAAPGDSLWGIGCSIHDPQLIANKSKWGKHIIGNALMNVRQNLK